jgi:hypothetical protein
MHGANMKKVKMLIERDWLNILADRGENKDTLFKKQQ